MKTTISVYSREPDPDAYPAGLANSVHIAVCEGGEEKPFNRNYGILFVPGEISSDNTIIPMGIRNPGICRLSDDFYLISGTRVYEDGTTVSEDQGKRWCWKSRDLIRFEELGLLSPDTPGVGDSAESAQADPTLAARALAYWDPPVLPEEERGSSKYPFPLAKGYGDPVIFSWEGHRYFVSTYDNLHDIGIYVREADSVRALFAPDVKEHLVLPYDPARDLIQTFWAPEFHVIGGELYLLFAVSGQKWGPQCHMMRLRKGGHITDPDSWEDPVRVLKMDGSPLAEGDAITLDMTFLKGGRASYVVWSYRKGMGTPLDTGSMLYIATINEREPWKLTSDPVLLSRPLFGWENVDGTINNEGPYAFIRDHKIYMTYSGGAANFYTYAVGLFTAEEDADLLDPASWQKRRTPVLSYYSVDEYGPGHNSFFTDDDGRFMIAYHAERNMQERLRCDAIRRVFFKEDGTPYFV